MKEKDSMYLLSKKLYNRPEKVQIMKKKIDFHFSPKR